MFIMYICIFMIRGFRNKSLDFCAIAHVRGVLDASCSRFISHLGANVMSKQRKKIAKLGGRNVTGGIRKDLSTKDRIGREKTRSHTQLSYNHYSSGVSQGTLIPSHEEKSAGETRARKGALFKHSSDGGFSENTFPRTILHRLGLKLLLSKCTSTGHTIASIC